MEEDKIPAVADDQTNERSGEEIEKPVNEDQWCFSYYAGKEHPDFNERAGLLKNTKWIPGDIISISFLDGEPELHARVKKVAEEWTKNLANLIFEFRNDNDTDIRISFLLPGSWSVLGTTCRSVEKNRPTMNFGWLKIDTPDAKLRRVVLHEFGHALGLIHEHMNPEGGIKWDKPKVIQELSQPPNSWSEAVIENNMFKAFTLQELALTRMDKTSIMMYPIPARWTLDGFSTELNTEISETDKEFIKQQYPG